MWDNDCNEADITARASSGCQVKMEFGDDRAVGQMSHSELRREGSHDQNNVTVVPVCPTGKGWREGRVSNTVLGGERMQQKLLLHLEVRDSGLLKVKLSKRGSQKVLKSAECK